MTDADIAFPSGDAFVVYPLDESKEVVTSLRLYVFNEAMQDMRALCLLERLTDREEVQGLLSDIENFNVFPRDPEYILTLREQINDRIEALLCDAAAT